MQFTEQQISAVARVLSDRAAEDCEVDKEDNWKTYSENYIADAQAALAKLSAAAPQVVADERAAFEAVASRKFQAAKFDKYPSGKYLEPWVEDQWMGWQARAALAAAPVQAQHSDDIAVDRFATAMKEKMAASRAKGRSGWDDPAQCTVEKLAAMLCQHVEKGDPVDIANFAMMIHERQGSAIDVYEALAVFLNSRSITAPVQPVAVPDGWQLMPKRMTPEMKSIFKEAAPKWNAESIYGNLLEAAPAAPAAQGDAEPDMFLRGVIAALGALAPHSQHGDVLHDEIVKSIGKEALYHAAESEDVVWAGLDPEFYAAIAAKAAS